MPLSQGDILRCQCRHKYNGIHEHINTIHVIYDTVATPNTAQALLEDIAQYFGLAYSVVAGNISTRLDAVDIAVFNVTDDTPVGVTAWGGGYGGGASSADGMPYDDAAVAVFYTGTKRRIGKLYLGGLIEPSQNDGILGGGFLADFGGMTAALLESTDNDNGSVLKYVVYSRKDSTFYLPTVVHLQPVVAQQERRKPGRGS